MPGGYLTGYMSNAEKLEHWESMVRFWKSVEKAHDTRKSKGQISYYKKLISKMEEKD